MKRFAIALALGLSVGGLSACETAPGASSAAATSPAPTRSAATPAGLIDRFDEQALRSIVKELGYKVIDFRQSRTGKPSMSVEADPLAFEITGESCEGEGKEQVCQGVQLSVYIPPSGSVDVDELMATANRTLRPAKVFLVGDNVVYERYLIMDGGVSRENLKTEISVYVEILDALFARFSP